MTDLERCKMQLQEADARWQETKERFLSDIQKYQNPRSSSNFSGLSFNFCAGLKITLTPDKCEEVAQKSSVEIIMSLEDIERF